MGCPSAMERTAEVIHPISLASATTFAPEAGTRSPSSTMPLSYLQIAERDGLPQRDGAHRGGDPPDLLGLRDHLCAGGRHAVPVEHDAAQLSSDSRARWAAPARWSAPRR